MDISPELIGGGAAGAGGIAFLLAALRLLAKATQLIVTVETYLSAQTKLAKQQTDHIDDVGRHNIKIGEHTERQTALLERMEISLRTGIPGPITEPHTPIATVGESPRRGTP